MEIKEEDKTCTKCKLKKLISEFSKDKRQNSGLHSWCKDCNHKRSKQYRIDHPEHCKKLDRNSNIRKCGATPEEWDAKFIEQSGCCAICGIHQSNLSKSFATDHDHITGKFRGLLCDTCNRGIGLLKDRIDILLKAADYLTKYMPL